MTRVLLTGGSGFLAAHVLDYLIQRGHSVVTTVRSQAKGDKIKESYSNYGTDRLDAVIVPDIAAPGAFDAAVQSNPPFEAVIHVASPFTFAVTDIQTQLLDPAILGTTEILTAIKAHAPTVKRVILTSSFVAMWDPNKGSWPDHTYSEADTNPITEAQALSNPGFGYLASKTFAEQAAWRFVEEQKPNFTLTSINPPMIYGPVLHHVGSLDALNTSNSLIRDAIQGKFGSEIPPTTLYVWVDVRDAALLHVLAMEKGDEAAGRRFFAAAGRFSNREMVEVLRKRFPEYADKLPTRDAKGGDYPEEGLYRVDNSRARKLLGKEFITYEQCLVDLVKSLKGIGA